MRLVEDATARPRARAPRRSRRAFRGRARASGLEREPARALDLDGALGEPVLHGLERADRATELAAPLQRSSTVTSSARAIAPTVSAASATRQSAASRAPEPAPSASPRARRLGCTRPIG